MTEFFIRELAFEVPYVHDPKLIICLLGPTASGKTQLAIKLVDRFPFEIISVDSAMVYRGMNIGTAKPGSDILKIAPHRLIDILDPSESYSAAQFCKDAHQHIKDIFSRGKIPFLVGGTMLYFNALQKGLSELPSADPLLREQLNQEAQEKGWSYLHERLSRLDPQAASRIHPHDSQRIQRALEVYEITGKSLTECQQKNLFPHYYEFLNIALVPSDRSILHTRIMQRFHQMLDQGFVDEVAALYQRKDLNIDLPSIRSVGYRQIWEYLQSKTHYDEMREKGIIATRQLAKRQLTWLRNWPELNSYDSEKSDLITQIIDIIFKKFEKTNREK